MTAENTSRIPNADEALARFEQYLQREPLNEELAAVQRGELSAAPEVDLPQPREANKLPEEAMRGELTRADRVALRELRQSEGYPILQGLLKKRFQLFEKRAITISKVDPLLNKDAIAKEWAYLGAMDQVMMDVEALIAAELKILFEQEQ